MRLAGVCSGLREGLELAERMAGGRTPQVCVPELVGQACTPSLKGPRPRRVPAFLLGGVVAWLLPGTPASPGVGSLGSGSSCLVPQRPFRRPVLHWKFGGELSGGSTTFFFSFL